MDEFQSIRAAIDGLYEGRMEVFHQEPDKPEDGVIIYADGTDWNPGHGRGYYWYDGVLQSWRFMGVSDFYADIAMGKVPGHYPVNKFGCAIAGIQTTTTDIWDRADSTPTQQIWLAPTAARIHQITSTHAADTLAGAGAKTLRIWGLTDWDTAEVSEDIDMAGTSNVPTVNSYVIIHRMKVLTYGASGPNVGTITATADTDATITAQINALFGQTQMAIYGIPSTQELFIRNWYGSMHKSSGAAGDVNFILAYNRDPANVPTVFLSKETRGTQSTGSSGRDMPHIPPKKFTGPGILKIQGVASAADIEGDAGFDGYLKDLTA
jgi:hypothetical protein